MTTPAKTLQIVTKATEAKKAAKVKEARATAPKKRRPRPKKSVKMEPFPLGNYALKIQGMLKNPEHRNWRVLSKLWNDTWKYHKLAYAKYLLVRPLFPADQKKDLDRQWNNFSIRMRNYKKVLELQPSVAALQFTVVRGFLLSPKGAGHIADYLVPMSLVNQSDAVLENMLQANREFFLQTPKDIAAAIVKGVEEAGDVMKKHELIKWGGAVLGTVIGGLIVVRLSRGRR